MLTFFTRIRIAVLLVLAAMLCSAVTMLAQAPAASKPSPWLQAAKIDVGVWKIDDNAQDNMYLVEGKDKALLIDTGLGIARLSELVKTLTSKPVIVVNTHGHPDHSGGNFQFKTVYAHPADFAAINQMASAKSNVRSIQRAKEQAANPDLISLEEAQNAPASELLPVKDGYVFDLGGRKIEVIETPGHTPGEIVLLDAANKLLFTGDNDNNLVWLFLQNSLPLETYLQSLKKLNGRAAEFDTIFPGHNTPMQNTFIADQIGCVEGILNGSLPNEPYRSSVGGNARLSKFRTAQVAFNPENLRVKK